VEVGPDWKPEEQMKERLGVWFVSYGWSDEPTGHLVGSTIASTWLAGGSSAG
jgi:hypothetical protein